MTIDDEASQARHKMDAPNGVVRWRELWCRVPNLVSCEGGEGGEGPGQGQRPPVPACKATSYQCSLFWVFVCCLMATNEPTIIRNTPNSTGIATAVQNSTGAVFWPSWLAVGTMKSSSTSKNRPHKIAITPNEHKIPPCIFFMACSSGPKEVSRAAPPTMSTANTELKAQSASAQAN